AAVATADPDVGFRRTSRRVPRGILLSRARCRQMQCARAAAPLRAARRRAPNPPRTPRCESAAPRPSRLPSAPAAPPPASTTECDSTTSYFLRRAAQNLAYVITQPPATITASLVPQRYHRIHPKDRKSVV